MEELRAHLLRVVGPHGHPHAVVVLQGVRKKEARAAAEDETPPDVCLRNVELSPQGKSRTQVAAHRGNSQRGARGCARDASKGAGTVEVFGRQAGVLGRVRARLLPGLAAR